MIVGKGIGSNRLVTSGYGWEFSYAEAVPSVSPVVSMGSGGYRGLPWDRLGYVPYRDRPPDYVMPQPRRPRRLRPPEESDVPSEIVDLAAAAEVLPAPSDAERAAHGVLSALGEPSIGTKTGAAVGTMQGLAQAGAPQERRGWSTGAKVALAVGAVGTAGLCVAAGYLIGRRLRAKSGRSEETEFCCGGRARPEARGVRAPRKADHLPAKPQPRAQKRRRK